MYQSRIRFIERSFGEYLRVVFTIHSMERSDERQISDNDILKDIKETLKDIETIPQGKTFAIFNQNMHREVVCIKEMYKNQMQVRVKTMIRTNSPNYNKLKLILYAHNSNHNFTMIKNSIPFLDLMKKVREAHAKGMSREYITKTYDISEVLVIAICNRKGLRLTDYQLKELAYECLNHGSEERQLRDITAAKKFQIRKWMEDYANEQKEVDDRKDNKEELHEIEMEDIAANVIEKKEEGEDKMTIKNLEDLGKALEQNTKDLEEKENAQISIVNKESRPAITVDDKKGKDPVSVIEPSVIKPKEGLVLKDVFDIGDDKNKYIDPRKALLCMKVFDILIDRECCAQDIDNIA